MDKTDLKMQFIFFKVYWIIVNFMVIASSYQILLLNKIANVKITNLIKLTLLYFELLQCLNNFWKARKYDYIKCFNDNFNISTSYSITLHKILPFSLWKDLWLFKELNIAFYFKSNSDIHNFTCHKTYCNLCEY